MKKNHSLALTPSMIEKCKREPLNRSSLISQALLNAGKEPDLLVRAFRLRLGAPKESTSKIAYTRDSQIDPVLEKLIELTALPGEQVIRLSLEAYVNRL